MVKHLEIQISQALTDKDWKQLNAFKDKAERLISTKLASSEGGAIHGRISYQQAKGLWFEGTLPPEEQITELLMAFRFFYLQKEPTHLPKIINIIKKHTNQPEALELLKSYMKQWQNSLFANAMNISLNNKQITTSLLLDLWFNAHYFHTDEDKEKELKNLYDAFSKDFSKYMFLDSVYGATKIVYKLYNSMRGMLEEHSSQPAVWALLCDLCASVVNRFLLLTASYKILFSTQFLIILIYPQIHH